MSEEKAPESSDPSAKDCDGSKPGETSGCEKSSLDTESSAQAQETPSESVSETKEEEKVDSADEAEELEPTEIELLKGELEALTTKLLETQSQLSDAKRDIDYAKAETQTVMRRGREDVARAVNRAKRDLMLRLTDVADTFSRSKEELSKIEKSPETEVIGDAVKMAIDQFTKVLDAEGLQAINPEGEAFDPQFHEAQAMVPVADKEPGTVIQVLRVGYRLDDTLLRAAQVLVSKQIEEPEATNPDNAEEE